MNMHMPAAGDNIPVDIIVAEALAHHPFEPMHVPADDAGACFLQLFRAGFDTYELAAMSAAVVGLADDPGLAGRTEGEIHALIVEARRREFGA